MDDFKLEYILIHYTHYFRARNFPRRESESTRLLVPWKLAEKLIISWDFYMRATSRTFDPFSGLGKRLLSNDNSSSNVVMLSSEMHPRSGAQSIYDEVGNLIVKMEEDYVPPRRYWQVNTTQTYFLAETFDYQRRLTQWQWGNLKVHTILNLLCMHNQECTLGAI